MVNVSSAKIESRHPTGCSNFVHFGAARLSPDNQRLYLARSDCLNYRYSIQCLDLDDGQGTLADGTATGLWANRAGHLAGRAGAGFGLGI